MIIPGENAKLLPVPGSKDAGNHNDPTHSHPTGPSTSSEPPPPSYQSGQGPPSQPIIHTYTTQSVAIYRQSPMRRFWSAFAVALLVWFLFTLSVQSLYSVVHWNHSSWGGRFLVPAQYSLSRCSNDFHWALNPHTSQTIAKSDLPGQHLPYSSATSFELPLPSKTLIFLSRGYQTYGKVNVVTSDEAGDLVRVNITIKHAPSYFPNQGVMACHITRGKGESGVGLFTRRWYGAGIGLYYEATVLLPKNGSHKAPLLIEGFETDAPNTAHIFEDLRDAVNFTYINIKGSNAPLFIQSLNADTAVLETSNSPITGVFNISRSLVLRASNSPIDVDVGMHNEKDHVSDLLMRTSNGKINGRLSLFYGSAGGRYMVTAMSSNGALDVSFPTSPVDSALKLLATTSNAPARISLDPAYEGTFSLTTSNFSPSVRRSTVKDPSGKHRKRVIDVDHVGRMGLKGSVSWSNQEGPGTVELRSSNSPITIEL